MNLQTCLSSFLWAACLGFFPEGSRVLYAHLGGAPAINGYGYTFRNG